MADFVIFPPRWSVADNTFRPPYYHSKYLEIKKIKLIFFPKNARLDKKIYLFFRKLYE